MNLGVIVNVRRPDAESTLSIINKWADEQNWPILHCERIDMERNPDFQAFPRGTFTADIDLLLALGGDGTILTSVRTVAPLGIPVLGINLGTLGFLTIVSPGECRSALDRIRAKDYCIEERLMLEVSGPDRAECWMALNDVVLMKSGIARMVRFTVSHNGEPVTSIAGDGIIVSTPTGSTAYSLSVGGPIVMPTMRGCIMTPISPHTLAQRPMVFDESAVLDISIDEVVGEAILTVDGQLARRLGQGSHVVVRAGNYDARLINFTDKSYFRILRDKLHWGIGPNLGHERDSLPT
jgi:NAD+ kinase